MTEPDPRSILRATLAGFDERRQKIVGAMMVLMIENPGRVRNREWVAEQFLQVALLAGDFEDVENPEEGVERVRAYARDNIDDILNACYELFRFTAEDLISKVPDGVTRPEAIAHALAYMMEAPK